MTKIGNDVEVKVGEDGLIVLRRPTNAEWNKFEADRYPLHRNKVTNAGLEARCALFDKLLVEVENVEDNQGPITVEGKDRIPNSMKGEIIFQAFESGSEVEVKN